MALTSLKNLPIDFPLTIFYHIPTDLENHFHTEDVVMKYGTRSAESEKSTPQRKIEIWEEEVKDLELCLTGDQASKRWQKIKVELTNLKSRIRAWRKSCGLG